MSSESAIIQTVLIAEVHCDTVKSFPDILPELNPNGGSFVPSYEHSSRLRRGNRDLQTKAQGRCHLHGSQVHVRHYGNTEVSQILFADIHRTYAIAVVFESTRPDIVAGCRLLSIPTPWTGL